MDGSGNVEFKEEDGIDYAPVTVQLPGGERVPFLFTIKELNAKGSLEGFGGDFVVPSYRGSSFLDPKVTRRSAGHPRRVLAVLGHLAAAALPHGASETCWYGAVPAAGVCWTSGTFLLSCRLAPHPKGRPCGAPSSYCQTKR